MSGHRNFKQLNDVSYLRFNFTYMPQCRPQKPRLALGLGLLPELSTAVESSVQGSQGARQEKECRSRHGLQGLERRMGRAKPARLSACTCHMHSHVLGQSRHACSGSNGALPAVPCFRTRRLQSCPKIELKIVSIFVK